MDSEKQVKQCSSCGEPKQLETGFHRNKNYRGGYTAQCKECRLKAVKAWRKANPDKVAATRKRYQGTDKCKEMWKRHRLKHLAKRTAYLAVYREENRDQLRAYDRKKKLAQKFEMTVEQYDTLLVEQGGVCAACKQTETVKSKAGKIKSLAVDHCHKTGRNRALLCQRCNIIVGQALESPQRLRDVADWIENQNSLASKGR